MGVSLGDPGPVISNEGMVYVVNRKESGQLTAISPGGQIQWEFAPLDCDVLRRPALAEDGTLYVPAARYRLYAVSREGQAIWRTELDGNLYANPIIDGEGIIYGGTRTADEDGKRMFVFHALDSEGQELWNRSFKDNGMWLPVFGVDRSLYFVSNHSRKYQCTIYAVGDKLRKINTTR